MKVFFKISLICFLLIKILDAYPQSTLELYNKGNDAILHKDYKTALTVLNKYLKKVKDNEHAYLIRSEAKFFFKDYNGVIEDCQRVFALGENNSEYDFTAMWNIGNAYIGLKQFDKALNYLEKYKIHNPANENVYAVKAFTYFAINEPDSVIIELKQLLLIDPNSLKAHYGIGRAKASQKKFSEAVEFFDKAIQIDPDYGLAYQNRSVVRLALNDFNGHCEDVKKCIELGIVEKGSVYALNCE